MTSNPTPHALDLRALLKQGRTLGELSEVCGADWNFELGAISGLKVKRDGAPALLFDEMAGYPKGYRVVTCSSSPARLSLILRGGHQPTHRALDETLRGKPKQWQAQAPEFDPVVAETGPVFEDIDPSNMQEVMWTVATRSDPEIDIDIIKRGDGTKNDPMSIAYRYKAPLRWRPATRVTPDSIVAAWPRRAPAAHHWKGIPWN